MAAERLRLDEGDARRFYLVRAVEASDRQATLLTREDRSEADLQGARLGESVGAAQFLAARANFAAARLETRHPAVQRALAATRFPGWLVAVVPLLAFALGLATNELFSGKRLDLLAVPLLGLVAWNLVAYLAMGLRSMSGERLPAASGWLANPRAWLAKRGAAWSGETSAALAQFGADWARVAGRLNIRRGAIVLHLAAALFALGVVVSIYLRALTVEYRAGWESTFLGPEAVQTLLGWVLGPASMATGIAIPDVDGIRALSWENGGENAGPWIVLYTATLVGFVAIPRLLLAGWNAMAVARAKRRIVIPGREDFYTRRLLRARGGGGAELRVTPYAYTPDAPTQARLADLLRAALGEGVELRFDDPVPYGNEDDWVQAVTLADRTDIHVALFSLSATPERENHGWFADALRLRLHKERPGQRLVAVVDEGPYRRHFAGQAGLEERVAERRAGWEKLLRSFGVTTLALDVVAADPTVEAQRLEALTTGEALAS